jgi:hypothetical protein
LRSVNWSACMHGCPFWVTSIPTGVPICKCSLKSSLRPTSCHCPSAYRQGRAPIGLGLEQEWLWLACSLNAGSPHSLVVHVCFFPLISAHRKISAISFSMSVLIALYSTICPSLRSWVVS